MRDRSPVGIGKRSASYTARTPAWLAAARGREQRLRMELDRRTFLILPAAAALTGSAPASTAGASAAAVAQVASGLVAGARALGIHRVGQLNMTEHDPVALDVEA